MTNRRTARLRARWITAGLATVVVAAGLAVTWRHHQAASAARAVQGTWQCSMHPQIIQDHPGDCPICHMKLERIDAAPPAAGRKILRYRHPMNPAVFSDTPRKDEMGMDFIPVYADEQAGASSTVPGKAGFALSERRQQLIGVRTTAVARRTLVRTLHLPGRVAGDKGQLLAQLLEMDAGRVAAGMDATVIGPEGQEVSARVTQVDEGLDTLTRSFPVTLTTRDDAGWLRAGVFCEVRVGRDLGTRLAIPADAVLDTGDQQVVFVALPHGYFEPRKVRLGRQGDDLVEVVRGLEEGERVVTAANFLIDSESRFRAALQQF